MPKALWIQGGVERVHFLVKDLMPGENMTIFQLYLLTSILKQQKWYESNHNLNKGDIVQSISN